MELAHPLPAYSEVSYFRNVKSLMNRSFALPKLLLLFSVFTSSIVRADAQAHCDLEKFASFFANDVEFYHDQSGVTRGKEDLTDSIKKNICGKVTRELVPGTLQVHHMKGYGAVEMGVHRFHNPGHDDTEPVGEGKFIHLWQYKDGAWKITRVISYDHRAAPK